MKILTPLLLLITMPLFVHASAHASDETDATKNALIEKVTAAYGGPAIADLTSFSITKSYIAPATGQSRSAALNDLNANVFSMTVDIRTKRSVFESLFTGRGGHFQTAIFSDGETAQGANFIAGTLGVAANADYYVNGGGVMRTSDALLVHELIKSSEQARYLGEADYLNRPHDKIQIPFPQSPDLTLYVDKESGLLSKMTRDNPQLGQLDYVFSDYAEHGGVRYALKTDFFVAGVANLISVHNTSRFNIETDPAMFTPPTGLVPEGERIDVSEMKVRKISNRVYHVGQGPGFSLFVDTSDGLVGVGGYGGLRNRFDAFRKSSDIFKPLRWQVITHHHSDHLAGVQEAVALGATLVTVDEHKQPIDAALPAGANANYFSVTDRVTFGEGRNRVEVIDVATIHAAHNLLVYVPAESLVFVADHINSPFVKGLPTANLNTVSMYEALQELDIDVRRIVIAHGAREFSMKEMAAAVKAFKAPSCLGDRPVCLKVR